MCIQDMQALSNALRIGLAMASAVAYVGEVFYFDPTQPNPIQPLDGPNPWPSSALEVL